MGNLSEKISSAELEIMHILWEAEDALSITDIRLRVSENCGWESTTIKTLVKRLCNKGVVNQEKRNVFYYSPAISEAEYQSWATGDLIRRLYKGSAKNLAAALVRSDGLSREDVDELRSMFKVEE